MSHAEPHATPEVPGREPPRVPRATLAAAAALLAIALFAAREALVLGRVFYLRDLHLQWYGQIETWVRAFAAGAWPLWDPLVAFGRPLLANPNNQLLYPLTWLNLVLRPELYFTLFFVLHVWLAGLGAHVLARRCGASFPAALVGAALFSASGPLLSLGNLWNHLAAAAWLPWTLVAGARFARAPGRGTLVAWGVLLALSILAGSPDVCAMAFALNAADVGARLLARRDEQAQATRGGLATGFALALLLSLALSAAQWLPALELASSSGRATATAAARAYWSLPPALAAQTLVPLLADEAALDGAARQALFGGREPLLLSVYLGVGVLALVAAAFLPGARAAAPRPGARGFWALAAGVALLYALGAHGPLYGPATALLPPLRLLRYPSKAMLVVALGAAMLAALGTDAWRHARASRVRWLAQVALPLFAVAGLALGLAGAAPAARLTAAAPALRHLALLALVLACAATLRGLRPRAAPLLLIGVAGVAVLDPLWTHRALNPTAPAGFYAFRPEWLSLLRAPGGARTYVVDYAAEAERSRLLLGRPVPYVVAAPSDERWRAALAMRAYPVPPVLAGWGQRDGYSRDLLGLHPRGVALLHALLLRAEGTPQHTRLLRLGAVTHVVSLHEQGLDELTPVARVPGPFFEPLRVYAVPAPLPRASIVGHARRVSEAAALEALADPAFDPADEVLVMNAGDPRAPAAEPQARAPAPTPAPGTARIVDERADRVSIEAHLARPGWLVLADAYDPGWRATVDGRAATVQRANLAFRALALEAGAHRVELVYRPRALVAGLALSALALLLALSAAARGPRPARAAAPGPAPRP